MRMGPFLSPSFLSRLPQWIAHAPRLARLYGRLLKDRRVRLRLKVMWIAAVLYVISPLDFVPEMVVPLFGYADDLIIFIFASRLFVKLCPQEVVWEHVQALDKEKGARK